MQQRILNGGDQSMYTTATTTAATTAATASKVDQRSVMMVRHSELECEHYNKPYQIVRVEKHAYSMIKYTKMVMNVTFK